MTLFIYLHRWLLYESESIKNQLQWFVDALRNAERENEKVHVIAHVPPQTSSCLYAWLIEYKRIVLRFANTITGQFHGHTHLDEFNIFFSEDNLNVANVAWIGGSATSFIGLNSNYRLYYVDSSSFVI